jgi:prevent-host-death family protein
MNEQHSIADARSNLAELVRKAEAGKAVELTRRGEHVAVLIGWREYRRFIARPRDFWEAYLEFRRNADLESLDIDPDEVFANVRDRDPGRDVIL